MGVKNKTCDTIPSAIKACLCKRHWYQAMSGFSIHCIQSANGFIEFLLRNVSDSSIVITHRVKPPYKSSTSFAVVNNVAIRVTNLQPVDILSAIRFEIHSISVGGVSDCLVHSVPSVIPQLEPCDPPNHVCSICMDEDDEGCGWVHPALCSHGQHAKCIAGWLSRTCPLCRVNF